MAEPPATFLEALLPASLLMNIEAESPATFLEALLPASLLMNIEACEECTEGTWG